MPFPQFQLLPYAKGWVHFLTTDQETVQEFFSAHNPGICPQATRASEETNGATVKLILLRIR